MAGYPGESWTAGCGRGLGRVETGILAEMAFPRCLTVVRVSAAGSCDPPNGFTSTSDR